MGAIHLCNNLKMVCLRSIPLKRLKPQAMKSTNIVKFMKQSQYSLFAVYTFKETETESNEKYKHRKKIILGPNVSETSLFYLILNHLTLKMIP